MERIEFADFAKVDIRAGKVLRAEPHVGAHKPAMKLWIDFGPEIGEMQTSARIADGYSCESLPGRQVMAVVNLPPRQIGKFLSEVLLLGVPDADGRVVLIAPDESGNAAVGGRMH